ncbi:MAG: hypothetical protein HBSAPP03_18840 [Phycisphaerae bacterium]|nr:MAG: hypothetical protein HBSAPP03_18840 [Phycisphaerae bacterium]
MAVYFDRAGEPRCWFCWMSLKGRSASGRCPQCNHWYTLACSRVEPGRARLLALLAAAPKDWMRRVLMMRVIAIVALTVGNTAIILALVWLAWRELRHTFGL